MRHGYSGCSIRAIDPVNDKRVRRHRPRPRDAQGDAIGIKLQWLLKPAADTAGVARLRRWLGAHGARVTSAGSRSLAVEVDADAFRSLFGEPPQTTGGFVATFDDARALPVPTDLGDVVDTITPVPRQESY